MIEYLEKGTKLLCIRSMFRLKGCGKIHNKIFTKEQAYNIECINTEGIVPFVKVINDNKLSQEIVEVDLKKFFIAI